MVCLSKFCYHTSSCDPQSKVAIFSPRSYQRPRCVRRIACRLLQLASSNNGFEFCSDTEGISAFLRCLYCLMLVRTCSRSNTHPSIYNKWVHTRLRTRKLGSPRPSWPSVPQRQNRPHLTSSRVHYAVRLLLIAGHNLWYWGDPQQHYGHTKFCENLLTCYISQQALWKLADLWYKSQWEAQKQKQQPINLILFLRQGNKPILSVS